MATKQITTWDEFVAAWTDDTITEDTNYQISTDIDISGTIIDSGTTFRAPSTTYVKTFTTTTPDDMTKRVKINGITSYTSGNVFVINAGARVGFKCVDFSNLAIYSGNLFSIAKSTSLSYLGTHTPMFYNCTFTGNCGVLARTTGTATSTYNNLTASCVFYQCAINIKGNYLGYGIDNCSVIFSACWVHFDKLGDNSTSHLSSGYFVAINTYFTGSYSYNATNTNVVYGCGRYSGLLTCVYDIDTKITGSTPQYYYLIGYSSTYLPVSGTGIFSISRSAIVDVNVTSNFALYNSDKMTTTKQPSSIVTTGYGLYALTDSELSSVSDINTKCPNFPIVE